MTPSTQKSTNRTSIIKHMKSPTRESTLVYCVYRGPQILKMDKIIPTMLAFIWTILNMQPKSVRASISKFIQMDMTWLPSITSCHK